MAAVAGAQFLLAIAVRRPAQASGAPWVAAMVAGFGPRAQRLPAQPLSVLLVLAVELALFRDSLGALP
jgi:hypothetical protein